MNFIDKNGGWHFSPRWLCFSLQILMLKLIKWLVIKMFILKFLLRVFTSICHMFANKQWWKKSRNIGGGQNEIGHQLSIGKKIGNIDDILLIFW